MVKILPDWNLPSLSVWGNVFPSLDLSRVPSKITDLVSRQVEGLPARLFPLDFSRNLPNSLGRFAPLENYLAKFRPQASMSLESTPAVPFIVFLGASAFLHGLFALGGEGPDMSSEAELRREGLIEMAQQQLEKLKSDRSAAPDFSYFLIQTETVGPNALSEEETQKLIKSLQEKFQDHRHNLPDSATHPKPIHALATRLYYDYFFHYAAAYPNLKNFLEHGKGNCVAQTKMFLTAFGQSGIVLPKGYGVGIQVFKNHIQPVLYHKGENGKVDLVQNLITGGRKNQVVAPIFDPAIALVGFLAKQGEESPLTFEDLLIERPADQKPLSGINGVETPYVESQPIAWPNSEVPFDGEAPEDAILRPPDFGSMESPEKSTSTPAKVLPGKAGTKENIELRMFSDDPIKLNDRWIDFKVDYPKGNTIIYFRTSEQRDLFSSLSTDREREDFLIRLAQGSLRRIETTEEFRITEATLKDPLRNFSKLGTNDLNKVRDFLNKTQEFALMAWDLNNVEVIYQHSGAGSFPRLDKAKFFETLPRWANLHLDLIAFGSFIFNHPKDVLLMLNQINGAYERVTILRTLQHLLNYLEPDGQNMTDPLADWITDPKKVAITTRQDQETTWKLPPGDEEYIEVEILGEEIQPHPSSPEEPPKKPLTQDIPSFPSPEAQILVSPQTMIDLILYAPRSPKNKWDEWKFRDRWDGTLSAQFLARDNTGYDYQNFKWVVHHWLKKTMERREPQFADWWRFSYTYALGVPKDYEKVMKRYREEILPSPHWVSFLPPHLLAPVQAIQKKEGPNFFTDLPLPKPPEDPKEKHNQ